ncbi:sugar ABC transporter permease [Cryobacterium sp. Hh7]|uniref:carbohydrate ABC transporter permease n=1 Tax=Cryobacterium sp. Hh7 TaxID=1259159 RepID=UPI0010696FA9|nr:sugar ABC transporter permease [Cryobacterium sp. Hh7]TFD56950.1 sugar ABC transporter permease [Cryobacterium sp. Hh7]
MATTTLTNPPKWQKSFATKARREQAAGALYALPAAIFVIILFAVPLALAFWMSLNDWPLIGEPVFNAPDNYIAIGSNTLFIDSILFTLKYTLIITVIFLVVSLALALLVQNARPGVGFFRTAFLLPAAVGLASSSLLFYALYNNEFGPLDDILRSLGLLQGNADFLGTPDNAFASTVVMVTWRFAGFNMIILLTGLQAIPLEVYEASRTDGAGWWQTLWHVTLPLLKPTILLILVLSITGSLLAFEPFYVLTAGGPSNSTVTMVMAMFREAFTMFDLGSAAAIAIVLLVSLVVINAAQLYFFRERNPK